MSAIVRLSPLVMLLPVAALAQSPSTSTSAPAAVQVAPVATEVAPTPAADSAVPDSPAPAADPAAPAQSPEEAAMLAELMAGAASAEGQASSGPSLRFYGFVDFGAGGYFGTEGTAWDAVIDEYASFAVGNLNLFADAQIADGWSSLAEIRFMFLPHGAATDLATSVMDPVNDPGYQSTGTPDYTNYGREVSWGAIHIERVYLQFTPFSFLTVRAGRFLTPYGIWNVDHGSPVIIGTGRPYIIGEQFFPEAQTGLELLGSVAVGDNTLGYHLTLSNGRGPTEVYRDLDGNKALGARLYFTSYALGQIDVGASGYIGTYTDRRRQVNLSSGTPVIERFDFEKYEEVALSADLKWQWQGLLLQSEVSVHDQVWDDAARPASKAYGAVAGQTQPDVRRFGVYVLAGYELPYDIMPYAMFEHYDTGMTGGIFTARSVQGLTAGINYSPVPGVVLKGQYLAAFFQSGSDAIEQLDALQRFEAQAAWAF
jgi:hypothetical protein